MAVPEQTPFIEFTANGTTTVFPLPFQCDKSEYLIVSLDGNEAPVGSWSFVNDIVTFNTAPANGVIVSIERNTPFQRTTEYQSYNNSFRPSPVNKDFDLIWWKLQELGYRDQVIWLALVKEIADRISGDVNLQNQINTIDEWLTDLQQSVNENTNDISQLVNDLSKEIADRITGDQILKDMFISMIDEAINEGTINALAITHLDSLEALEGVTNVWDGRTIYIKDLGNYRYDALTTSWVKAYQDADNVKYGDKTQKQFNDEQLEFNSQINKKFSNLIVIDNSITDISNIINSAPSSTLIQIRNGNYTASGIFVEKDDVLIQGQSMDGVKITTAAGASGNFIRFGKRGPSTDYHSDNLPQYNGTIDYWDESQFSPALPDYPRYNNIGIDNVTIILSDANGIGSNTGVDFYRVNNPILNAKVKWTSKFAFGNGVRIHFCKNMQSKYLEVEDNEYSTYTVLYYWSYGLNAGIWKIGKGQTLSIDFKHSVRGYVKHLESTSRGETGISAVNFGYGGIDNTVDKLIANNGDVTIKASVEFDVQDRVYIKDLYINNPNAEGLTIMHATNVRIDNAYVRALKPLLFQTDPFYMFSNARAITPSQSTGEFIYDGNYRTSKVENGITKYFEKRPLPILKDGVFGKVTLIATTGALQVVVLTFAGGVTDLMNSSGMLRRFEDGGVSARGYNESYRTSFKYDYSSPFSLDNVDFGNVTVKAEAGALSTITSLIQFSAALDKCRGTFKTYADKMSWKHIWSFDTDITVETNRFFTNSAGYVIEMESMVRSTLRGKWLANGRVVNFKGGSASFYKDGYKDHALAGRVVRSSTPTASPPFVTNFASSTPTWKPLRVFDVQIYAEDGASCATDVAILRHLGSIPTGYTDQYGGGYLASRGCFIDFSLPFYRSFTDPSAATAPTLKPNTVGELAMNATTGTWWKANTLTTWSQF